MVTLSNFNLVHNLMECLFKKLPRNCLYFTVGRMEFLTNVTPPSVMDIARSNPYLNRGGIYQPPSCTSRYRVAMIIPHRARETHLRSLLAHLHPLMQRQQLHYRIFVIHQVGRNEKTSISLLTLF